MVSPKLTYRLVWDVKIQNVLLARFARQIIINKFKLYLLPARHVRIYFQTGSPLVMIIVWYIVYSPFSQLEWPIIMTKQLLIICEWCSLLT